MSLDVDTVQPVFFVYSDESVGVKKVEEWVVVTVKG